ncbi:MULTISPECIES: hypothetical protein [Prauserella salsuginis group]|uniref:Nucleoside-diphosphate-sugar epimerase n=1 Tax=Prauserella salsuginis TaxID=387889 RepID=A0ABW6FX75_9PSEU|nr:MULTISPECIES: hypothetical protein [Prauserella salsuginis group]MCR3720589.1 Uncharacterized conserved protein YbjT, contains NAD(P)-binding and DUF2867 domains [Prauserella flava]MCR3733701.1 Uncharacterized conserved protein YbjT, contains NAD(P)-binding and DUF2867 domains [Prauserella salsuginis]
MMLLTAMPASRAPGAVPTVPVVRTLAERLSERGQRVRVLVPESEAGDWPDGVELHLGRVTDPAEFAAAVADAELVFLAGLVGEPLASLRELTTTLVTGRVRRVVVLGSHGSDFDAGISDETWQWSAFERCLENGGIGRLWLRPTAVMASADVGGYPIPGSAVVDRIRRGQQVHEYLPTAPYAFIHEDDLAEIAATLLLGDRRSGTVDVSGTTVSAVERLAALGAALGVEPQLVELTADEAAERWRQAGWPEDTIGVMLYALPAFAAQPDNPALREQEETARTLLGRPPQTFRQWAARLADRVATPDGS